MIAIIGAMDEEIDEILKEAIINEEILKYGFLLYKAKIKNKDLIIVKCGIGMVNAALITTILINEFNVEKIYFSGVAGSCNEKLKIGDIVISTELQEYLFDATEFGYEYGVIPRMSSSIFVPKDLLKEAKQKINKENVYFGKIVSGDKFVHKKDEKKEIYNKFNALAVDMESAAVAHVCCLLNKDFLIIRSISDSLSDDSAMEYSEFVNLAAKNSKKILMELI